MAAKVSDFYLYQGGCGKKLWNSYSRFGQPNTSLSVPVNLFLPCTCDLVLVFVHPGRAGARLGERD